MEVCDGAAVGTTITASLLLPLQALMPISAKISNISARYLNIGIDRHTRAGRKRRDSFLQMLITSMRVT